MRKNIFTAALMGWLVLLAWQVVVNGISGFEASINMNHIAEESTVYELLKEHVITPGRYTVNPGPLPGQGFPLNEPVFSVYNGGVGHESAGSHMVLSLVSSFLALLVAVWMLSCASEQVLASYSRKVLFFTAIGTLFALVMDVGNYGIGGYPAGDAVLLGLSHVLMWTAVGLAVAWWLRPSPGIE